MTNELVDLEHALDLVNKVNFAGAPSATKAEALATMSRLRNKFDAADARAMRGFEATQEHRAEGHSTPIAWLKSHCREEGKDAARRRRVSRFLKSMTLVEEALTDGLITVAHVERLHRAQLLVGEEAFALAESALVDAAVLQRFSDFVLTLEYFVVRAAPRDAEERQRRQVEDQYASSSRTFEGNGVIDAQIEPIGFTIWDAELQRLCAHLLEQDRAEAHDRLGRRPLPTELRRTTRQRRAAAMVLMAQRSSAFEGEDLGLSSFTLVVHSNDTFVRDVIEMLTRDLNFDPDLTDDDADLLDGLEYGPDSLHELDDGTVVTANTIILALLTGCVRGLLFDPDGEPLRFGHERRLFTKPQAMALRAKYRRCCHPYGCDATAPWLQTDHIVEHHDGGRTDIDNGQPMDEGHNIWKTNHKHDPPPDNPDRAQRRLPPDTRPLPPTDG